MTKDEALRLALEKLTAASNYIDTLGGVSKGYRMDIERIKAALEVKDEPVAWMRTSGTGSPVVTEALLVEMPEMRWNFQQPLYTTPQQQEAKDEPVAWRDAAIRLGEELSSVGPDSYYDMNAKEWLDWAMKQKPRGEHSLPQRTWVKLTDEQFLEACKIAEGGNYMVAFQRIQQWLKKNNT